MQRIELRDQDSRVFSRGRTSSRHTTRPYSVRALPLIIVTLTHACAAHEMPEVIGSNEDLRLAFRWEEQTANDFDYLPWFDAGNSTLGDFDSDGDLDLVIAQLSHEPRFYRWQNGRFRYATPEALPGEVGATAQTDHALAVDANGDGRRDLILIRSLDRVHRVHLFLNTATPRMERVDSTPYIESSGVFERTSEDVVEDFDLDGDEDFVLLRTGNNVLFENRCFDPTSTPVRRVRTEQCRSPRFDRHVLDDLPIESGASGPHDIADLNGDGYLDLVVGDAMCAVENLACHHATGDAGRSPQFHIYSFDPSIPARERESGARIGVNRFIDWALEAGLGNTHRRSAGALALFDVDEDQDLDVVVFNIIGANWNSLQATMVCYDQRPDAPGSTNELLVEPAESSLDDITTPDARPNATKDQALAAAIAEGQRLCPAPDQDPGIFAIGQDMVFVNQEAETGEVRFVERTLASTALAPLDHLFTAVSYAQGADIDRDGIRELLFSMAGTPHAGEGHLAIASVVDGQLSFRDCGLENYEEGFAAIDTELADLDQDGDEDLLAFTGAGPIVHHNVATPTGACLVPDTRRLPPSVSFVADIVTADFNRDQHPDIFVVGSGDSAVDDKREHLLLGTPSGRFEEASHLLGAPLPYRGGGATAFDANGDGWPDLLIAELGPLRLLLNRQGLGFDDVSESYLPLYYRDCLPDRAPPDGRRPCRGANLTPGDFDGDGFIDILLIQRKGVSTVLFNDNGLRFVRGPELGNTPLHQNIDPTVIGGYRQGRSGAVGDFDGDGRTDIAFMASTGEVVFLENQITEPGGWRSGEWFGLRRDLVPIHDPARGAPSCFAVGDLDGDDVPDVLVGTSATDVDAGEGDLFAYLAQPVNGFSFLDVSARFPEERIRTRNFACAISDVDTDGDGDVVVASYGIGNLTSLDPAAAWPTNSEPTRILVNRGDRFERDGRFVEIAHCKAYSLLVDNFDQDAAVEILVGTAAGLRLFDTRPIPILPTRPRPIRRPILRPMLVVD